MLVYTCSRSRRRQRQRQRAKKPTSEPVTRPKDILCKSSQSVCSRRKLLSVHGTLLNCEALLPPFTHTNARNSHFFSSCFASEFNLDNNLYGCHTILISTDTDFIMHCTCRQMGRIIALFCLSDRLSVQLSLAQQLTMGASVLCSRCQCQLPGTQAEIKPPEKRHKNTAKTLTRQCTVVTAGQRSHHLMNPLFVQILVMNIVLKVKFRQ